MNYKSKIVFLCDWLPPDFGAVGQYAVSFCESLAMEGHQVTLIGFNSHKASKKLQQMGMGQLTILRVYRPAYDKAAWLQRFLWTLSANLILIRASWSLLGTCDEIRFTGSPPFMLHFILPVALMMGKKTRYRITDFHPEGLIASIGFTPWWMKPIVIMTHFWRRRVDLFEVLGEDQRRCLLRDGIAQERIMLVRDPSPVQFLSDTQQATAPSALIGRSIILYSGNWGAAHDVDTFVDGFTKFCKSFPNEAGLWLNATGKRADLVEDLVKVHQLPYARTKPVPLEQLSGVLLAADIHLITLNNAFVAYALPSKVYACVASGKSILFIGSPESDVHLVCTEALSKNQYRRVDVGDAMGVANALTELLGLSR